MNTRNINPKSEPPKNHEVELPVPERKNDIIKASVRKLNKNNMKKEFPKTESNAKWPANRINESFNASAGSGISVDEKGESKEGTAHIDLSKEAGVSGKDKTKGMLGDTRRDSIIDRPRTETYEKDTNDETTKVLYKERDEEEEKW